MPEMSPAVKTRLQAWWGALDGGNQAIFEAIYMDAPATVSQVISGGEWVADDAEPGLAAQLGTDNDGFAAAAQIPLIAIDGDIELTPPYALPGTKVTISWTELNDSAAQLDGYYTDVYVQNDSGETVASTRLTNPALASGGTAARSFEFPGTDQAGQYYVSIYMNAEGIEKDTGVPGPQGYRSEATAKFAVGSSEAQAASRAEEDWITGLADIDSAAGANSVQEALQRLFDGLQRLATAADWGAADEGLLQTIVYRLGSMKESQEWSGSASLTDPELENIRVEIDRLVRATRNSAGRDAAGREVIAAALRKMDVGL